MHDLRAAPASVLEPESTNLQRENILYAKLHEFKHPQRAPSPLRQGIRLIYVRESVELVFLLHFGIFFG